MRRIVSATTLLPGNDGEREMLGLSREVLVDERDIYTRGPLYAGASRLRGQGRSEAI